MTSTSIQNSDQCLEELAALLSDLEKADQVYRPTRFWANCSQSIVLEFKRYGLTSFKSLPSSIMWFVPSYAKGLETYSRRIRPLKQKGFWPKAKLFKRIEEYLDGKRQGLADYRVTKAAFKELPAFMSVGESLVGDGLLHEFEGRNYSKASLNYLRGLALLQKTLGPSDPWPRRFLEIGGGSGCLGEIVLQNGEDNKYIDIDIPPVLTAATYYLKEIFGHDAVCSYRDTAGWTTIDLDHLFDQHRAATLPSWQLPKLSGSVDCFVNFVSFQEMEPHVVENYIKTVQPLTMHYVVLRNSHHGKRTSASDAEVGVATPTTIDMMISWFNDFEVVTRDSITFGEESRFGKFRSEIVIMHRKH